MQDILGPLTTPYFLSFVRQTEPFSSPLGKRNSSSATLTNLPIAESKFPPHPFLLDRQKDYPEPVILLSQKMQHYRRLQLDLFFAIATSQRANVRDACGGEVLETFLSALEEHPREVAAASYLSSLILLDTPGELLDLSKRNESLEAELISGLTTACDFLERACLIRRGLGRKWEASVELLAKELVQIKNRGLKMSPRGEGIAVLDLVAGDEEEGSAERAAGFRRWQLKKVGHFCDVYFAFIS